MKKLRNRYNRLDTISIAMLTVAGLSFFGLTTVSGWIFLVLAVLFLAASITFGE